MEEAERKVSGITKKILLTVIPVTLVVIAGVTLIATLLAGSALKKQTYATLATESQKETLSVSQEITRVTSAMETTISNIEKRGVSDAAAIKAELKPSMEVTPMSPNGLYLALEDGTYIDPTDWVPGADFVPKERDWYKDGLKSDTFVCGEPYKDAQTGEMIVTFSRRVQLADGRTGVIAFDLTIDSIVKQISQLKPLETGGAALLTPTSVLSYFHEEDNGKKIAEVGDDYLNTLQQKVTEQPTSVQEIKSYNGTTYDCYFAPVDGTNWALVTSVDQKTVYASIVRTAVSSFLVGLIGIVLVALLIWRIIIRSVAAPVRHLTDTITQVAGGDFTVRVEPMDTSDEIGQMNNAMQDFVHGMHGTLTHVADETKTLSTAATSSKQEAETLRAKAAEQSDAMGQVTGAMNNMAQAVTELAENASNLAGGVSDLADKSNETNAAVGELLQKAQNGQQALTSVESKMSGLSDAMTQMNEAVTSVGASADKIAGIINMIDGIAEQTNLLSLNASIEAARAGEAGRGFAVVASEIGTLASNSSDATKQIAAIIEEVTASIKNLADSAAENVESIQQGTAAVTQTSETFKDIFQSLDHTSATIEGMIDRIGKANDIAASVAAIAEEQSATTEEVTATVDNIAATAQAVASSSQQVSQSADAVKSSADSIDGLVHKFKI